MARLTKRTDDRYMVTLSLGTDPATGKRIRRVFYGKTQQEANDKKRAAQAELDKGRPLPKGSITVGSFFADWLEHIKNKVRPKTFEGYNSIVNHILPTLGRTKLVKLDPLQIDQLLRKKSKDGLSPRTCRYILGTLRRALGQAEKWGLVARNVALLVDMPTGKAKEGQYLTPDQAGALLKAVEGQRNSALWLVLLSLGLRRGEVLGLRWQQDVNLDKGTLSVNQTLQRVGKVARVGDKGLYFEEPKTERSRRTIPLPAFVLAALKVHKARQAAERLKAGPLWADSGLVF